MTEKVFELLSAVTFKCNDADVAKYAILSITDTEANVIDKEDGYKAYSIPYTVTEVGYFAPGSYMPCDKLLAGDVGYVAASIKSLSDIHVGDTITFPLRTNPLIAFFKFLTV